VLTCKLLLTFQSGKCYYLQGQEVSLESLIGLPDSDNEGSVIF